MYVPPTIDPELKALIPPLLDDERVQLEQNILMHRKCRDPIVLWDGVIVDGHNRFEICKKHGIEFEVVEKAFESKGDAMAWIIENQLGRRNLTDVVRIELILFKMEMLRKKAKKKQVRAGKDRISGKRKKMLCTKKSLSEAEPVHVLRALADEASVGRGTLQRYMDIKENGSPHLLEQVKNGELKIGTAHRLLTKEILTGLRQVDKMYKFIADSFPFKDNEEANIEIKNRLSGLSEMLNEILTELSGKKEEMHEH